MRRFLFSLAASFSLALGLCLALLSLAENEPSWLLPWATNVHIRVLGGAVELNVNPPDFSHSVGIEFSPTLSQENHNFFIGSYDVRGYAQPSSGIPPGNYVERELLLARWFILTLCGILPAAWLIRQWMSLRRFGKGCCRNCGYDLRASSGSCPECGTAIRDQAKTDGDQ